MNKAYNRINWENYPSDSTPLNEDNLNKMDVAINEVDNRVISLDTTKLPVATAYTMVKDVAFDEKTGVFTITKLNGSVIKIDTALEKISTNFRFDYSTQKLILTLIDGTTQEVDLSALLTQYEFTDSNTIAFTIDTSGKVVASVKKGSITQDMLEPNYLANIKVEVAKAESASISADTSAKNAKTSETNAKTSEEKAKEYAQAASGEAILEIQTIVGGEIDENTGETNVEYSVPQESEGKWSLSTVLGGSVVNALKQATKAITEEFVKISDFFAKKSLYDDTTINVGRLADSVVGNYSTAEGHDTTASGSSSHAEGSTTVASGSHGSHSEGLRTTASNQSSHAEGYSTTASGKYSHAEGNQTTASSNSAHSEGALSKAQAGYSHAEGYSTTASGESAHAEGNQTTASGMYSHAEGYSTTALNLQHAMGTYNDTSLAKDEMYNGKPLVGSTDGTAFVIGNGTGDGSNTGFLPSNAFRVTYKGVAMGKSSFASSGADYAEYFEWKDGNSENEDRVGYFVTFADGRFIKKANEGDYILGIVSGMPCVIGNNDECWMKQFEMDIWGRFIYETHTETDEETGEEKEYTFYKVNPDYDATKPYTHREERPEWAAIGMFGVLSVYDDGTCQVNGYCKCGNNGIATAAERGTDTYRVLERINDNVIKVALK